MADSNQGFSSSLHCIPALRGTENYNVWRIQTEDILTDLDLYGHVSRTITCPPIEESTVTLVPPMDENNNQPPSEVHKVFNTKERDKWTKRDRKALLHVRLCVEGHVLTHIQQCSTSADAWDLLALTFQVKGTVGLVDLRGKFFSHRMTDGEDLEAHIQKMREWFQQINNIAAGSCSEVDWITTLVASLPDSWDTFTQSIDFKFSTNNLNKQANQISDLRAHLMAEAVTTLWVCP